jgi:hypothetical protein
MALGQPKVVVFLIRLLELGVCADLFPAKNAWSSIPSNHVVLPILAARYQLIQAARV